MGACRGKCRIQLAEVVPAALESVDLRFAHVCDELPQLRGAAEETLEVVVAVVGAEGLELTIRRIGKCAQQRMGFVARKENVPVRSP